MPACSASRRVSGESCKRTARPPGPPSTRPARPLRCTCMPALHCQPFFLPPLPQVGMAIKRMEDKGELVKARSYAASSCCALLLGWRCWAAAAGVCMRRRLWSRVWKRAQRRPGVHGGCVGVSPKLVQRVTQTCPTCLLVLLRAWPLLPGTAACLPILCGCWAARPAGCPALHMHRPALALASPNTRPGQRLTAMDPHRPPNLHP